VSGRTVPIISKGTRIKPKRSEFVLEIIFSYLSANFLALHGFYLESWYLPEAPLIARGYGTSLVIAVAPIIRSCSRNGLKGRRY